MGTAVRNDWHIDAFFAKNFNSFRFFSTHRCKKGSRVYAMYPQTTSLYPATVIDSTTYCRNDDDIIVVEFDGEEQGQKLEQRSCLQIGKTDY